MSEENVGLFPVNYIIGTGLLGAPTLRLSLLVNTPAKAVLGGGRITQATNPPVSIRTDAHGTYTYMATMKDVNILIVATGSPAEDWPSHAGIGPAFLPNFHLRMVVTRDWASGTAFYKYQNASGTWVEVNDVPVKLIAAEPVQAAA